VGNRDRPPGADERQLWPNIVANTDTGAYRNSYGRTYGDSDFYTHVNTYGNSDFYAHVDTNGNAHRGTYGDPDRNIDGNRHCDTLGNAYRFSVAFAVAKCVADPDFVHM
jgi:hypothetical protein